MHLPEQQPASPLQELTDPLFTDKGIRLFMKREDLIHPEIPGNKWRKLFYNLIEAKKQEQHTLLTFGGAYSNHLAAVAAAGKLFGFKTIGLVRGEEQLPLNPTLSYAVACGMHIFYVDRAAYKLKNTEGFIQNLEDSFGEFYLLPEGGTNTLAVKGCAEIIAEIDRNFDVICCPAGTGGTLAGLVAGLAGDKQIIGFPAIKDSDYLYQEIAELVVGYNSQHFDNWSLQTDYHFGGYAKIKPELIDFIKHFNQTHEIQLEPVYTGKMMYGLYDLIRKDFFKPGTTIIAIHTGGLQGIEGFKERLGINVAEV